MITKSHCRRVLTGGKWLDEVSESLHSLTWAPLDVYPRVYEGLPDFILEGSFFSRPLRKAEKHTDSERTQKGLCFLRDRKMTQAKIEQSV